MSEPRDIALAPEAQALKLASRALVRAFGGTDAAGEAIKRRQQFVSDCTLMNTGAFLTIDQVARLEDVTVGVAGHPHVTRALAARQKFVLVKLPDALPTDTDLLKLVAAQAKKNGDLAGSICSALADNKVDSKEARAARALLRDLLENAAAMDAALALIENEGDA